MSPTSTSSSLFSQHMGTRNVREIPCNGSGGAEARPDDSIKMEEGEEETDGGSGLELGVQVTHSLRGGVGGRSDRSDVGGSGGVCGNLGMTVSSSPPSAVVECTGMGFGLTRVDSSMEQGQGQGQRGQAPLRRPPCCGHTACMARALRKQHSVLVQQVQRLRMPLASDEAKVKEVCEAMHQYTIVLGIQVECLEAIVPLLEREEVRKVAQESALGHAVVACLRNFAVRIDLQVCAILTPSCGTYCFDGFSCLTKIPILNSHT